jgi:hypothetical protein
MVRAPRMVLGVHSAEYTGVVLDLAPTAKPSMRRAASKLPKDRAAAIQKPVATDTAQDRKMVNRRPPILLRNGFVQHPISAEQRYGAPFIRPFMASVLMSNSS